MEKPEESAKKFVEPSDSIAKTKEKLARMDRFFKLDKLTPEEKKEALKSINNWISLHHNSREPLVSESMGLFKNNEETVSPSKAIKQFQKDLHNKLKNNDQSS